MLPSTLTFPAKQDDCTSNLAVSFYLYLNLKPLEKGLRSVSFSDSGLRDPDIMFRDETGLVFCFLGWVVKFLARDANSWRRKASLNPGNGVCVTFFSFFFPFLLF